MRMLLCMRTCCVASFFLMAMFMLSAQDVLSNQYFQQPLTFNAAWERPTTNFGTYTAWAQNWAVIFTTLGSRAVIVGFSPEMNDTANTIKLTIKPPLRIQEYIVLLKHVSGAGSTGRSRVIITWGTYDTTTAGMKKKLGSKECDQYPSSMIRYVGFGGGSPLSPTKIMIKNNDAQ